MQQLVNFGIADEMTEKWEKSYTLGFNTSCKDLVKTTV